MREVEVTAPSRNGAQRRTITGEDGRYRVVVPIEQQRHASKDHPIRSHMAPYVPAVCRRIPRV